MFKNKQPYKLTKIVYLPYVIYSKLKQKRLSLESILDLNKVRDIFSLEDLASILILNQDADIFNIQMLTKPFAQQPELSLLDSTVSFAEQWKNSNSNIYDNIVSIKSLVNISDSLSNNHEIIEDDNYYMLTTTISGIFCILNPKMFIDDKTRLSTTPTLLRDLIIKLYGNNEISTIAHNELFNKYINNII